MLKWRRHLRERKDARRVTQPNRLLRNKDIYNRSSIHCLRWLKRTIQEAATKPTRPGDFCTVSLLHGVAGAGKSFASINFLDKINCIACGTTHTATNALPSHVGATTLHRALGVNSITLNMIKAMRIEELVYSRGDQSSKVYGDTIRLLEGVTERIVHDNRHLIATAIECTKQWQRDSSERQSADRTLTNNIFMQLLMASTSDMSQRAWMLVNNLVLIDEAGQTPFYYLALLCVVWRTLNKTCLTPQYKAGIDLHVIVVGSTSQSSAMHADTTIDSIMDFCLSDAMTNNVGHCKFLDNRRCVDDDTAELMIALESGMVTKRNNPASYGYAELAVRSREEMMDPSYEPFRIRLFRDHASVRTYVDRVIKVNQSSVMRVDRLFLFTNMTSHVDRSKALVEGFYSEWNDALTDGSHARGKPPSTKTIAIAPRKSAVTGSIGGGRSSDLIQIQMEHCSKSYLRDSRVVCSDSCTATPVGYRGSIISYHRVFREEFAGILDRSHTVTEDALTLFFATISMRMVKGLVVFMDKDDANAVACSAGVVSNPLIYSRENIRAVIYKNDTIVKKLLTSRRDCASLLESERDYVPSGDTFACIKLLHGSARVDVYSGTEFTLLDKCVIDYETVSFTKRTHGEIFPVIRSHLKEGVAGWCSSLILMSANGMVVSVAPKLYRVLPYLPTRGVPRNNKDELMELNMHDEQGRYAFAMDHPFTMSCIAQTICKSQGKTMSHVIVDADGKPPNKQQDYVGVSRAAVSFQSTKNIADGENLKQYFDSMSAFVKDTMLVI